MSAGADGLARHVLHVLPHPGGGGETYVDILERMDGYRFDRRYLARGPAERRPDRLLGAAARAIGASRRYDLLHVHGEVAALLVLPALAARRSLLTLHGLNLLRRSTGAQERLARANLRAVVRAADRTICSSQTEYDQVREAVGESLARRLELIRNGVSMPEPTPPELRREVRSELSIPEDALLALAVGGLEPVKDPLTPARAAVAAARDVPLVLCFAGDGPLRPELERVAAGEGGSAVRLLGQRDDLDRIYAAADVLVLASRREGLPFSVLEGMAHGLAPLVSDGTGCAEAAGDAAVLARLGDVDSFAAGLRALAGDPADRAARGARARRRAETLFSATEMVAASRRAYDAVAARSAY